MRPMGTGDRGAPTETFTGELTVREGGYYSLLMTATGRQGTGGLERGAEKVIGVSTLVARLTGDAKARQASDAADASSPAVEVSVGLEAYAEATLLCAVSMRGPAGERLAGSHPFEMAPGQTTVTVQLHPVEPASHAEAYQLERVTLLDISGAGILLDERRYEAVP